MSACFGMENASWTAWRPTPGATAYWNCPGGVVDPARPHVGRRADRAQRRRAGARRARDDGVDALRRAGRDRDHRAGLRRDRDRDARVAGGGLGRDGRALAVVRARLRDDERRLDPSGAAWAVDPAGRGAGPLRGGALRARRAAGVGVAACACGCPSRTAPRRRWAASAAGSPAAAGCAACRTWRSTRPTTRGSGSTGSRSTARVVHDHGRALRLHAAGAVPERAGERVVRHARLGRRRACARAVGAGCGGQLDVGLAHRAGGQHGARGAGARPGGRRRVEPGADADARAAGAARAGRAARARACEGLPGGRALRGVGARAAARGASVAASVAAFDGPGEYALRVALEDAAGNVGPFAPPVTLRFDDTPPGAPDVSAADRWQRGGDLPLAAEGAPPVSGVRGYRVRIGGRDAIVADGDPAGRPARGRDAGGGPHRLRRGRRVDRGAHAAPAGPHGAGGDRRRACRAARAGRASRSSSGFGRATRRRCRASTACTGRSTAPSTRPRVTRPPSRSMPTAATR